MKTNEHNGTSGPSKSWFTWALLALLPGVTGWFIVLTQEQIQQNRTENYKHISRQQKEEFLEMYEEWSRLTPQEKADNPWGTGPYGGPEIQQELLRNQEERLLADLPDLLSQNHFPSELGNILYGPGWETRVEEYRKQIEYQEILSICSSILIGTGILALLTGTGLLIRAKIAARSEKKDSQKSRASKENQPSSPQKDEESSDTASGREPPEEEVHLFSKKTRPSSLPSGSSHSPGRQETLQSASAGAEKPIGSNKQPSERAAPLSREASRTATTVLAEVLQEETKEDPLLSSLMTPEPVARELTELTEQMSAIREFAAEQQSQVKKLQDGYDWMLIKRFCLRIIRCIDNIDDRIRVLQTEKKDVSALEDIRDELIFALESSGVEPYEPEIDRDYRGLEKYAEAVKDRKKNEDPDKTGKIAEIVRSGYQYLISDEEVKIVRCAQVKLYA